MMLFWVVLAGCSQTHSSEKLITEKEAIEIAKVSGGSNVVTWSARYKADEEIEFNNVTEKRKVWIVEDTYPAGNKEIYRIDAVNGKILVMTEIEADGT